jgi:hypothetical protein
VIECADDSCGVLGDLFAEQRDAYFGLNWQETGIAPEIFLRDLLEFATWEDYGLMDRMEAFFSSLTPAHARLAESILREIMDELRRHRLDYQEENVLTRLATLYATQRWYERFVEHAETLGSRAWQPILMMAKAAWRVNKRQLAGEVFGAADQPGFHQESLREECLKLTGQPPLPRKLPRPLPLHTD